MHRVDIDSFIVLDLPVQLAKPVIREGSELSEGSRGTGRPDLLKARIDIDASMIPRPVNHHHDHAEALAWLKLVHVSEGVNRRYICMYSDEQ